MGGLLLSYLYSAMYCKNILKKANFMGLETVCSWNENWSKIFILGQDFPNMPDEHIYSYYKKLATYFLHKFIFQRESTDFSLLKIIGYVCQVFTTSIMFTQLKHYQKNPI